MKALDGVTIIDFTQRHAGSVATMILADFGAKVIKVERADRPDPAREWTPMQNGHSVYFTYLNRGKEDVCVDYTTEAGRQVILDLVKTADVVCENLPVGEMERYGLDYDSLKAIKPDLIYASLSPFGLTGPRKNKKADDLTIQAIGGYMDRTGFADGPATPVGCRVSNHISAAYLATSINLALIHKYKTGQGQMIDLSELDCLFAMMETGPWVYNINGKVLPRTGNSYPSISPYDTLKAKDGFLSVGISTDGQWQKFCAAFDIDPATEGMAVNSERVENRPAVIELIEDRFSAFDAADLLAKLTEAGIPSGTVRTLPEVYQWEQALSQGLKVSVDHPVLGDIDLPGPPLRFFDAGASGEIETTRTAHDAPPLLDEDADSIVAWLADGN